MLTQLSEESIFLADFLAFLKYVGSHRIRTTTLKKHIPLHHLKDLADLMRGQEAFHPLTEDGSFEKRCQRDERRIDFMDMLAAHMELIERVEMGYMVPAGGWAAFLQLGAKEQSDALLRAFWSMDWNPLYPWTEAVDRLQTKKPELSELLKKYSSGQKIFLDSLPAEFTGEVFFWVVIRPLEYLGLAQGFFAKDAQGFWFPEAFEISTQTPAAFRPDTPAAKPRRLALPYKQT